MHAMCSLWVRLIDGGGDAIGTPIWASTLPQPSKLFLKNHKNVLQGKPINMLFTQDGVEKHKGLDAVLDALSSQNYRAEIKTSLTLNKTQLMKEDDVAAKLETFCEQVMNME